MEYLIKPCKSETYEALSILNLPLKMAVCTSVRSLGLEEGKFEWETGQELDRGDGYF